MTEKKGWGSTVMGWFVVSDDAGHKSANDEYVPFSETSAPKKGAAGATATAAAPQQPMPPVFNTPPPAAPGGNVDFDAVFDAAGIDAEERGRVGKAADLLKSLPAATDPIVRKQIVEASLRAFGVPIDQIIEAGVQEIQALEAYIRAGASDTEAVSTESDKRIAQLQQQIADLRTVMQERVEEQKQVMQACNDKKLDIQAILEFFGQDAVAKVVKESPKLHEPA
jgi:DNA-binding transcriptional MerR regulator